MTDSKLPPGDGASTAPLDDAEDLRTEREVEDLLSPLRAGSSRGPEARGDEDVPDGFADRVVAAALSNVATKGDDDATTSRDPHQPPADPTVTSLSRYRERIANVSISAGLAAVAATLAVALFQSTSTPSTSVQASTGMATLAQHETAAIGVRAHAVAERKGNITWEVDATGATTVNQASGRMFYRVGKSPAGQRFATEGAVARPQPFVVHTPSGDVRVLGTCFSVEIDPMVTTQQLSMWNKGKSAAVGALAGALLTGTILVTVYEGRVDVTGPGTPTTSLGAGEAAITSPTDGTRKVASTVASLEKERLFLEGQRKDLRNQVGQLEDQLKVFMVAKANGSDPVVAENQALKSELADVRSRLSAFEDHDADRRGKPMEWPDDIDDIYKEDYLKESMLSAIAEVGLKGDIDSVDCSEFPCVAFGEVEIDGDREASAREMKRMREALEKRYPDKVSSSNSIWSKSIKGEDGQPKHKNNFGISFYPDGAAEGDQKKQLEKRMRFRMQSYTDSLVE